MNLEFSRERWTRVENSYTQWWNGELERPLIAVRMGGRDPGRPEPEVPRRHFTAAYGMDITAEQIVDRWTYDLEGQRFLGDAFPDLWPNFGPGIMAGFLGADVHADDRTVWFHQPYEQELADIHLGYDPANKWFQRIKDICRTAVEHWDGLVQLGMTDLGGNLDVVSSFRPSERLLFDLYDHPGEVKRVTWDVHRLWQQYYTELNDILHSLLEIEELKGVQWIMGDGQPDHDHWLDVHRAIVAAGKCDQMFVFGDWGHVEQVFAAVAEAVGDPGKLILITNAPAEREADVCRFLARYGVPEQ